MMQCSSVTLVTWNWGQRFHTSWKMLSPYIFLENFLKFTVGYQYIYLTRKQEDAFGSIYLYCFQLKKSLKSSRTKKKLNYRENLEATNTWNKLESWSLTFMLQGVDTMIVCVYKYMYIFYTLFTCSLVESRTVRR